MHYIWGKPKLFLGKRLFSSKFDLKIWLLILSSKSPNNFIKINMCLGYIKKNTLADNFATSYYLVAT